MYHIPFHINPLLTRSLFHRKWLHGLEQIRPSTSSRVTNPIKSREPIDHQLMNFVSIGLSIVLYWQPSSPRSGVIFDKLPTSLKASPKSDSTIR